MTNFLALMFTTVKCLSADFAAQKAFASALNGFFFFSTVAFLLYL